MLHDYSCYSCLKLLRLYLSIFAISKIAIIAFHHPCEEFTKLYDDSSSAAINATGFVSLCKNITSLTTQSTDYFRTNVGMPIRVFVCIPGNNVSFIQKYHYSDATYKISSNYSETTASEWMYQHNFSSESFIGRLNVSKQTDVQYDEKSDSDIAFPIDFDHFSVNYVNNYTCHTGVVSVLDNTGYNYSVDVYQEYTDYRWYPINVTDIQQGRQVLQHPVMQYIPPLLNKEIIIDISPSIDQLQSIQTITAARNASNSFAVNHTVSVNRTHNLNYTDKRSNDRVSIVLKHSDSTICSKGFNKGYWDIHGNWVGFKCSYREDLFQKFSQCAKSYDHEIVWSGDSNNRRIIKLLTALYLKPDFDPKYKDIFTHSPSFAPTIAPSCSPTVFPTRKPTILNVNVNNPKKMVFNNSNNSSMTAKVNLNKNTVIDESIYTLIPPLNDSLPMIWCYNDSALNLTDSQACHCEDWKDKWPFKNNQVILVKFVFICAIVRILADTMLHIIRLVPTEYNSAHFVDFTSLFYVILLSI